jgi:ParB family chromosome partitioning protein
LPQPKYQLIEIKRLFIGDTNVRRGAGDITELTRSIEESGVLQPILVRPIKNKFEVVVGSRRYHASKAAGLKTVPAIIRTLNDSQAIATSLVENVQRGNLKEEDEIRALKTLMKLDPEHYGTQEKLAKELGLRQSTVSTKFKAFELVTKLRASTGRKLELKSYPSEEERKSGQAIGIVSASMIEEALGTNEVTSRLTPKQLEQKREELTDEAAAVPQPEFRKVLDQFKMYPEKPVREIKAEVLSSHVITVTVQFSPKIGRALSDAAHEKGLSIEEFVPRIVEDWLKKSDFL